MADNSAWALSMSRRRESYTPVAAWSEIRILSPELFLADDYHLMAGLLLGFLVEVGHLSKDLKYLPEYLKVYVDNKIKQVYLFVKISKILHMEGG